MIPLKPPKPWPPPGMPPPTDAEVWWSLLPILGIVPRWYLAGCRCSRHTWNVLKPIEQEIVTQLVDRKNEFRWVSKTHTEIAMMISDAIGAEKCMDPPPIVREDPFDLLFWGAYDDMTPRIFSMAFTERFGFRIPWPEMIEFSDGGNTVGEFIDHCVVRIDEYINSTTSKGRRNEIPLDRNS